jgi:hypothetical protein
MKYIILSTVLVSVLFCTFTNDVHAMPKEVAIAQTLMINELVSAQTDEFNTVIDIWKMLFDGFDTPYFGEGKYKDQEVILMKIDKPKTPIGVYRLGDMQAFYVAVTAISDGRFISLIAFVDADINLRYGVIKTKDIQKL